MHRRIINAGISFSTAATTLMVIGCGSSSEPALAAGTNASGTGESAAVSTAGQGAGGSGMATGAGGRVVGLSGGALGGLGGNSAGGSKTAGSSGTSVTVAAAGGMGGGLSSAGGSGGTATATGPTSSGARTGNRAPDGTPWCLTRPEQVVLIGDSYINWFSHTFADDLAGQAGVVYRNYAVGGYSMGSGGLGMIPPEFEMAVAEDPDIIASVLSGGGNDILIADALQFPRGGECKNDVNSPSIPDCQAIAKKAQAAFSTLIHRMAEAGVGDVVYFFYPNVPEGTLVGGANPNGMAEWTRPQYKALCDGMSDETGGKLKCHFVDLVSVLNDANGQPIMEYFAATDIHPNTTGSAKMAEAIWKVMKDNCIAQPASSGCCAP